MSTEQNEYAAYDDFVNDALKDNRVGDHEFMVTDVKMGKWSDLKPGLSNDPYYRIGGSLLTAGKAKTDFTWSPPPPADVLKAEKDTMDEAKKKAIATAISLAKQLTQFYGKRIQDLTIGDVFRVKTVKNKDKFIRVVAILPKDQAAKDVGAGSDNEPPF